MLIIEEGCSACELSCVIVIIGCVVFLFFYGMYCRLLYVAVVILVDNFRCDIMAARGLEAYQILNTYLL